MIDPNEIRLDNRLYMDWLGTQREIEVKGIFPDKIFFEDYWKEGETFCKPESLSGIPLTEEWLIKMGIGNDYKELLIQQHSNDEGLIIEMSLSSTDGIVELSSSVISKDEIDVIDATYHQFLKIKHVHQLQNIYFALTGEELTIKELV